MHYRDYVKDVFNEYERKKTCGAISARLIQPTTANLREECKALCTERFSIKDQGILKAFFGPFNADVDACIQAIQKNDVDKFRPLVTFMKKGKTNTRLININLLAWLIDYQDRPFRGSYVTTGTNGNEVEAEDDEEANTPGISVDTDHTGTDAPPPPTPGQDVGEKPKDPVSAGNGKTNEKWWQNISNKKTVVTALILLVANVGAYTLWTSIKPPTYPPRNEKCMYWADDHYQPVSCTQKVRNSLVIALDSQRLNQFRKITTPDTITLSSIGNVWYTKVDGNIEFYTSDGFHPIDIRLRLKPITQFIINKYIHPANASK